MYDRFATFLIKELKKREKDLNENIAERIKMVEKSGTKMGQILTKKNPFRKVKVFGQNVQFSGAIDFGNILWTCSFCNTHITIQVLLHVNRDGENKNIIIGWVEAFQCWLLIGRNVGKALAK